MSDKQGNRLLNLAKSGDFQAFAKLLTWLERAKPRQTLELKALFAPSRAAFRIGITGPPGAGKSTLVAGLLGGLSANPNTRVGVIAVDPSSPFSHGAILGDRIRYSEHWLKQNVFIRSMGTRGSLGGLSGSAYLIARAFDACDFDILLIETVGVGQTELEILGLADLVCVVLVPESGDAIQAMKAGLMEIADLFVVNKSDRPGADSLAREIEASIHDGENSKPAKVFKTVATESKGIDALLNHMETFRTQTPTLELRKRPERIKHEARALLRREWEASVDQQLQGVDSTDGLQRLIQQLGK